MEFEEGKGVVNSEPTEIQFEDIKVENLQHSLDSGFPKVVMNAVSIGNEKMSSIKKVVESREDDVIFESESCSTSNKDTELETNTCNEGIDLESDKNVTANSTTIDLVNSNLSKTNDKASDLNSLSSHLERESTACSEKLMPSTSIEVMNRSEVKISKNSALNFDCSGKKNSPASSCKEKTKVQENAKSTLNKGNSTVTEEPAILCNSNALNALWDYGVLISSDESADEEDRLPEAVIRDTTNIRKSVTSLDSDSSLSHSSLFFSDDSESDDESSNAEKISSASRPQKPLMSEGEIALDDLPPIEDLHLTVPEQDITKVGEVFNIVDALVIVQGIKDMPPLDLDSVLFLASDRPLGQIFDVFGPVIEPLYCIRFNSNKEIKEKNITPGMPVFYGPRLQYTNYVFMKHLLNAKGSDASWSGNNEPPIEQLDFSDDETERAAKHAIKAVKKEKASSSDPDEPQRKKHMAYEQRMNAMNLYMTKVSELKSRNQSLHRKKRKEERKEGLPHVIRPAVLSSTCKTNKQPVQARKEGGMMSTQVVRPTLLSEASPFQSAFKVRPFQSQPPPIAGAVALQSPFSQPPPCVPFLSCPLNFNRFMPPPAPPHAAALPKPSMFVDTSVPPPQNMSFPPPISVPPPAPAVASPPPTSFFCNVNLPPPPQPCRMFRSTNSINLNSLFPQLTVNSPPPPPTASTTAPLVPHQVNPSVRPIANPSVRPIANPSVRPIANPSFPFPPPPLHPTPGAPAQPPKHNPAANTNRLPVFNQTTFRNHIHQPNSPTPPPYTWEF